MYLFYINVCMLFLKFLTVGFMDDDYNGFNGNYGNGYGGFGFGGGGFGNMGKAILLLSLMY